MLDPILSALIQLQLEQVTRTPLINPAVGFDTHSSMPEGINACYSALLYFLPHLWGSVIGNWSML